MPNLTVACLECPTIIRREWRGPRTCDRVVLMLAEFFARVRSGDLVWR